MEKISYDWPPGPLFRGLPGMTACVPRAAGSGNTGTHTGGSITSETNRGGSHMLLVQQLLTRSGAFLFSFSLTRERCRERSRNVEKKYYITLYESKENLNSKKDFVYPSRHYNATFSTLIPPVNSFLTGSNG